MHAIKHQPIVWPEKGCFMTTTMRCLWPHTQISVLRSVFFSAFCYGSPAYGSSSTDHHHHGEREDEPTRARRFRFRSPDPEWHHLRLFGGFLSCSSGPHWYVGGGAYALYQQFSEEYPPRNDRSRAATQNMKNGK